MKCPKVSCVFALVILLSAVSSAFSAQVWTDTRITNTPWTEASPQIWGDTVYYASEQGTSPGNGHLWAWDPGGGSRQLTQESGPQWPMAVYGSNVVVGHYANGQYSLYLYDPVNGERLISATAGDTGHSPSAAIYGNTVVWSDIRSGVGQIYTWDPVNGERHIAPTNYAQFDPHISGNAIVWTDLRDLTWDGLVTPAIYRWNSSDGQQKIFSSRQRYGWDDSLKSAIYGDTVWLARSTWYPDPTDTKLYQWTAQAHSQQVADLHVAGVGQMSASASLVAWGGEAWDPLNGLTIFGPTDTGDPSVYGRTVAWGDGHDIYLSTLTPEPSSALALGLWSFGLAALLHLRSSARRKTVC